MEASALKLILMGLVRETIPALVLVRVPGQRHVQGTVQIPVMVPVRILELDLTRIHQASQAPNWLLH